MDQNHAKLLSYVIDFDGKLDLEYARKVFASSTLTTEFFYVFEAKSNVFLPSASAVLFEFAKAYYDTYKTPPTVDSVIAEVMVNPKLDAFRKEEINKALLSIGQFPVNAGEFEYVLDRVIEEYASNKAISIMHKATETLKTNTLGGVEFAIKGLSEILNYQRVDELALERTLTLSQFAEYLDTELYESGAIMAGTVPYPYMEANRLLGGMAPGELIVIAGPSNSGKSFIGHDIAYNAALVNGMKTVCADREMLHPQNGLRFLSRQTQIPSRKFRNEQYRTEAEDRLIEAALAEYKAFTIEDDPILFIPPKRCANTLMIRREIDTHWGKVRPKLIIADYLTEFEPTTHREGWESVRQITHDLKQLALHYACPVLTMAQVNNRGAVQYATIKHICDTLIILEPDPEQEYRPPEPNEFVGTPGIIKCTVDKARNEAKNVFFEIEVEFATASIRALPRNAGGARARDIADRMGEPDLPEGVEE